MYWSACHPHTHSLPSLPTASQAPPALHITNVHAASPHSVEGVIYRFFLGAGFGVSVSLELLPLAGGSLRKAQ